MKQMIISKPVEITLNGFKFLFEAGDSISVKTKDDEVIEEGAEEIIKYKEKQEAFSKIQKNTEAKIKLLKSTADEHRSDPSKFNEIARKIKEKLRFKKQIDSSLKKIKLKIRSESDAILKDFNRGNKEEAELDAKEAKGQKVEATQERLGDKRLELEKAKENLSNLENEYAEDAEHRTSDGESLESLTDEQYGNLEDESNRINTLESEIETLEKFEETQQLEKDEEGIEDSDQPESTDRIISQDELSTYPTERGEDWDDSNSDMTIGDKISAWLIDGGFQPPELGSFSDMVKNPILDF